MFLFRQFSLKLKVSPTFSSMRVDRFVQHNCEAKNHKTQALIKKGKITINGLPILPSARLKTDDTVEIQELGLKKHEAKTLVPSEKDLKILYKDEYFFVVEKPQGICVHSKDKENVVDNLLKSGMNFKVLHRLDKETSGLLILEHDRLGALKYEEMQKNGQIRKIVKLFNF